MCVKGGLVVAYVCSARRSSSPNNTCTAASLRVAVRIPPHAQPTPSPTDGSGVCAGFLGNDTVTVGNAAAVSYTFGQTTLLPGDDFSPPFGGIAGLAYDIIALPIGSFLPTVFEALIAGGDLEEPILHVYLSSSNDSHTSDFNFGFVDASAVAGPWTTAPMSLVQPLFGYWMTDVSEITVGGAVADVQFWGV